MKTKKEKIEFSKNIKEVTPLAFNNKIISKLYYSNITNYILKL